MIINPTKIQTKKLAEDVIAAAKLASLPPSRTHGFLARKLEKKFTLGRGAVPGVLMSIVNRFLVYDFFDRAFAISSLLGDIDRETWDLDYNYIRKTIHHTAYVAHRKGFLAEAAKLEPLVRRPADYSPPPRAVDGFALRLPFEKMEMWRSQPADMTSTIAGEAFMDLGTLSTMWLFGGSLEWSRERIDAFYDSTVEQIKALPGWEQW